MTDGVGLLVGAGLLLGGLVLGWLLGSRRQASGPPPASGAEVASLLAPAADALRRVEQQLHEVERDRVGAYAGLTAHLQQLQRSTGELGDRTRSLAGALQSPTVRGRWGEMQLRRVVELAGMVEHCDFAVQVSRTGVDGAAGVRPDLLVHLPGGRQVPVDAKVPLQAWLAATEPAVAADPARLQQLRVAHARAVRAHVDALADKAYWRAFQPAPEFVVLFLPGEALLDAALQGDPTLFDHAFARGVVPTTPTTLIALLRTVEFGWRQDRLSQSAAEILDLGQEMHTRLHTLVEHVVRTGAGLERAVESYNAVVGSLESRVLVTARRFVELGVPGRRLAEPARVSTAPRRPVPLQEADRDGSATAPARSN
jgi:DNA recombination protein RmuC